jgi:NAD(P)-dependent dehydrogenase (short-subunit alcohol dehydrogenase family)
MSSVVLISGASTGIGRLTAETVARAGHSVYATMRGLTSHNAGAAQALEALAAEQKLQLRTLDMDVCDTESVRRAVDIVLHEAGRIDVAVNNAGLMSIGLAEGFTEEQLLHQMNVNFMGSFRVSRAVLPHLRAQRRGLIVHVTSIVGRLLFPGCAPYCASKFAQEAFAEVLQYELAGTGVESVIVEPGPYPSALLPTAPLRPTPKGWKATVPWPGFATGLLRISPNSLVLRERLGPRMWQTRFSVLLNCPRATGRCVQFAGWISAQTT